MPAVKLSFGGVFSESYGFFFANLRLFFHLVTIPWIISIVIRIADALFAFESLLDVMVWKAIDVVPTVMFMVAWQRVVLLGPGSVGRPPGAGWSPRETAYLGHLIKISGITFVLFGAFLFTIGSLDPMTLGAGAPVDPEQARQQAMAAPFALGMIVSMLLALRVSFGLAATAVDVPFSPRLSWAYSRGNAWIIAGALFLTFFAAGVVTTIAMLLTLGIARAVGADVAVAVIAWTVAILVSYAGTALMATVQAVIFRRLLAWRKDAPLPTPMAS